MVFWGYFVTCVYRLAPSLRGGGAVRSCPEEQADGNSCSLLHRGDKNLAKVMMRERVEAGGSDPRQPHQTALTP